MSLFFSIARPSPPRNCTVSTSNGSNWTEDSSHEEIGESLVVRCVTGYDGGLPQLVVLEAVDTVSNNVRFNVTANDTGELFNELFYSSNNNKKWIYL